MELQAQVEGFASEKWRGTLFSETEGEGKRKIEALVRHVIGHQKDEKEGDPAVA